MSFRHTMSIHIQQYIMVWTSPTPGRQPSCTSWERKSGLAGTASLYPQYVHTVHHLPCLVQASCAFPCFLWPASFIASACFYSTIRLPARGPTSVRRKGKSEREVYARAKIERATGTRPNPRRAGRPQSRRAAYVFRLDALRRQAGQDTKRAPGWTWYARLATARTALLILLDARHNPWRRSSSLEVSAGGGKKCLRAAYT